MRVSGTKTKKQKTQPEYGGTKEVKSEIQVPSFNAIESLPLCPAKRSNSQHSQATGKNNEKRSALFIACQRT